MATRHAAPGELIDLHRPNATGPDTESRTLVRADHFEVFQLALPAGKELPEHAVASLLTIQCLEGRVEVAALGRSLALGVGTMIYLPGGEPHAVKAIEDSSILVTLLVNRA